MMVSPWANGLCQSPETIAPRLTIATFMDAPPDSSLPLIDGSFARRKTSFGF
jgi:hypothetical protein